MTYLKGIDKCPKCGQDMNLSCLGVFVCWHCGIIINLWHKPKKFEELVLKVRWGR